ncbi:minor capsid protein [Capybara microvirus Cap3_SP_445]|nr:minor capsid protein [Capybara microvirus Cap3_SP_445]
MKKNYDGNGFLDLLSGDFSNWFKGIGDRWNNLWNNIGGFITGSTAVENQKNANLDLQHDQQSFNSAEAQKERDWQTQMSNTAHQREVADLQAAGLNKWLSVNGGGSSSSSGAFGSSNATAVSRGSSGAEILSSLGSTAAGVAFLINAVKKASK